ncbi:MAG: hypothetical protein ACRCSQ_03730 [Bacteroidales bacterium]
MAQSVIAQTEALPDEELMVVKLFVDGKSKSYITASWSEEKGYSVRLFEILDMLEFRYVANWERHIFTSFIEQDRWYRISGDTIQLWNGTILPQKTKARWSVSNDLYVTPAFLEEFYQLETALKFEDMAVFITSKNSEVYRQNKERIRRLEQEKKIKEENTFLNVDTLRLANLKINAFSYTFSQNSNYGKTTNYFFDAQNSLRGELLSGAFYLRYNYGSGKRRGGVFDNLRFNWERLDLKSKLVKSVFVNHDFANLITSTGGYASSVTLSNTSKQASLERTYLYEGKTLPDSRVEVYNNNQIIEYVNSDSLGYFSVEIPVSDAENNLKAITYNALGIPVVDAKLAYVPTGAVGKGDLIYRLTTGVSDNGDLFINPLFEYGVYPWLSVLLGNETVVRVGAGFHNRRKDNTSAALLGLRASYPKWGCLDLKYMPAQLIQLRFSVNYAFLRTNVSYEHRSSHQTISNTLIKDLLQMNLSGNFNRGISGNYMLGLNYYSYQKGLKPMQNSFASVNIWRKSVTGNFTINTMSDYFRFRNPVFSTRVGVYLNKKIYNELMLEYSSGKIDRFRIGNRLNVQFKNKLTAFVDASYQFKGMQRYVNVGISWRLPFMLVNAGSSCNFSNTNTYAQLSGSVLFQGNTIGFSDMVSTSSSLNVALFVDANGNGRRDKGEPLIQNPKMQIFTAAAKTEMSDGVIFTGSAPNKPFRLSVPQQKLGDISWQIDDYNKSLILMPYQTRCLFIPVKVITEIAGQVTCSCNGQVDYVKNVFITITDESTGEQKRVMTDDWGNYIYMGLTCGSYLVDISPVSLKNHGMTKQDPIQTHRLEIKPALEGLQLDGFDFTLVPEK